MCACSGSVPVAKALGSGSSTIQMRGRGTPADRKSTRLNSSHLVISYAVFFVQKNTRLNSSYLVISYAVFCLKKKIDRRRSIGYGPPRAIHGNRPSRDTRNPHPIHQHAQGLSG